MRQIEITKFNDVVAALRLEDDFKKFIKEVQNSLDDYLAHGILEYTENKVDKIYDFSNSNNPIKQYIQYIKNIDQLFYCSPIKMKTIKNLKRLFY